MLLRNYWFNYLPAKRKWSLYDRRIRQSHITVWGEAAGAYFHNRLAHVVPPSAIMNTKLTGEKDTAQQSVHEIFECTEDRRGSVNSEEKGVDDGASPCTSSNARAIAEKHLLRRLDMRFMPTIVLIYIMNYIDRSAITTARLKGLEKDVGLTGKTPAFSLSSSSYASHLPDVQYDTAVAILYASYCTCQIPSNMLLNRVSRPSFYIGLCVIAWGLTSALTGITRSYAGIVMCRFCLGIPEAAFYPGTVYLLSRWYTRKGAITVTVGLLSLWSLPDLPNNTRWMSPAERQLAQARLAEDTGEADEDLAQDSMLRGLKMALTDVRVLIFAIMELSMLLGLSFANFFPTPPWVWAAIVCCVSALHADKTGERFFHTCFSWWGVIIGYIIALSTFSVGGRYVALFLLASGHAGIFMLFWREENRDTLPVELIPLGFALTLVWVSNTISRPPAKRAAAIGLVNGIGNTGNLIGSYAWKAKWGPQYHQSMSIGIASLSFSTLLALVMRCILKRMNKKLDEDADSVLKDANHRRVEDAARLEGISLKEAMERRKGFSLFQQAFQYGKKTWNQRLEMTTKTRWMSYAEKHLAQVHLSEDAGEADEDLTEDSLLQRAFFPIWNENAESEAGDGTYYKVTCEFVHKLIGSEGYSLLRYPYDNFAISLPTVDPPNRVPSLLPLESCLCEWTLPDLTTNKRWMSYAEKHLTQVRLSEDAGEADEDLTEDSMWSGLKMANEDVKVFVFSLILLGDYLGLAFTNFFPSLTKTLGFDYTITLLVSVIPAP
ncbi:MFS general substrate transporter [Sanghuangporus baumii]|uniref:MFS general substrate transporter n=1 Tax=Sanghuangporus baumii TaxID=108892 RepID=A0A9Q5HZ94_SANBA|nr:MFS general substrate transporter [Sanghuangporus baumii]